MLEKRGNVGDPSSPRAGHIEHAKAALATGDLLIAGALADPVDEALFIWKGDAKVAAEEFGAAKAAGVRFCASAALKSRAPSRCRARLRR